MLQFTLFRFPVTIHWMFWAMAAILGGGLTASRPVDFQLTLLFVVAAFISVLFHELGHAFFMRKYGGRPSIRLYGMGGLACSSQWLSRRQDLIVSFAGPAFGLILWVFCYGLNETAMQYVAAHPDALQSMSKLWAFMFLFLRQMIYINLWWSLMNLLPILPLDGGHITDSLLSPKHTLVLKISAATAGTVAIYFLAGNQMYRGAFFGLLAVRNFQRLQGNNAAPYWPGFD